jgi:hypothetical protein
LSCQALTHLLSFGGTRVAKVIPTTEEQGISQGRALDALVRARS